MFDLGRERSIISAYECTQTRLIFTVMFLNLQKGQEFVGNYADCSNCLVEEGNSSFESTVGISIVALCFWNRAWEISEGGYRGGIDG